MYVLVAGEITAYEETLPRAETLSRPPARETAQPLRAMSVCWQQHT